MRWICEQFLSNPAMLLLDARAHRIGPNNADDNDDGNHAHVERVTRQCSVASDHLRFSFHCAAASSTNVCPNCTDDIVVGVLIVSGMSSAQDSMRRVDERLHQTVSDGHYLLLKSGIHRQTSARVCLCPSLLSSRKDMQKRVQHSRVVWRWWGSDINTLSHSNAKRFSPKKIRLGYTERERKRKRGVQTVATRCHSGISAEWRQRQLRDYAVCMSVCVRIFTANIVFG